MKVVRHLSTLKMLARLNLFRLGTTWMDRFIYSDLNNERYIIKNNTIYYTTTTSGNFSETVLCQHYSDEAIKKIKFDGGNYCSKECPYFSEKSGVAYNSQCHLWDDLLDWDYKGRAIRHYACSIVKQHSNYFDPFGNPKGEQDV